MSLAARVGRAIFWGQAGRLAEAGIYLFFYLFLARELGPASYGLFALGMSLTSACGFLALLGLGPETMGRFLPEIFKGSGENGLRKLLGVLLVLRLAAILVVAGIVYFFSSPIAALMKFPLLTASGGMLFLVFAARSVFDLLTYFSSGRLDLRRVAVAKVLAAITTLVLFFILVGHKRGDINAAWLAAAGSSLAGIVVLGYPFLAAPREPRRKGNLDIPLRPILAFGLFAWATQFFVYILGDNTDILLLGWLINDRAGIGYYAAGEKIVLSMTGLLLGWAALVSVASLSEALQSGGKEKVARLVEAQWKLGTLCLAGPLLLVVRYAHEVVTIFYSPAYQASARVIEVLGGLMVCCVLLGFSLGTSALYATNHARLACGLVGSAAAFNIATEIILVRSMGMLGAAWATGLSFILLAASSAVAGRRFIPWRFPAAFTGKVLAACAVALAPTFWIHPDSRATLGAGIIVWGIAFLGSLAVLKPLETKDSAALVRVNPRLAELAAFFSPRAVTVAAGGAPWRG